MMHELAYWLRLDEDSWQQVETSGCGFVATNHADGEFLADAAWEEAGCGRLRDNPSKILRTTSERYTI